MSLSKTISLTVNDYVSSECAIMDVYSNYVVIKGYDLSSNKIMPIAMYKIPFEVI